MVRLSFLEQVYYSLYWDQRQLEANWSEEEVQHILIYTQTGYQENLANHLFLDENMAEDDEGEGKQQHECVNHGHVVVLG